ncbi:MAG: flagellin [Syntrophorhabdus sp. PtaB.Bin184]|jgi:flagellin|nr:MAG: flagellin [Syntrophorhabdus sp. PtaB.Bin184]
MSDISLTSGMRANLLSLQSSVKLLDRTQERLSTGKKVNSALDNPVNYFTALDHTTRANDLLAYKDGISEAIQTIKAADTAITAITTLINSAKATAEAAKSTVSSASTSQTLTFSAGITAGATVVIGGDTYTAVTTTDVAAGEFYVGGTAAAAATSLAAAIAMSGTTTFNVSDNGQGVLTISRKDGTAMEAGDITDTSSSVTESDIAANSDELVAKRAQYTTLLSQINDLKDDAYYKGKNLLGGTTAAFDLTVKFGNSHTLTVEGFDGSATGLGITTASSTWIDETTIDVSITQLESALSKLRIESSKLSSNLAVVNARDEWISSVANVLQTGADKLTLADTNEEGANMLMLQTRQSLSTSALSLSAQAAQSVLQLFQ